MTRRKKRQQEDHTGAFFVLTLWLIAFFIFAVWANSRPRIPPSFP